MKKYATLFAALLAVTAAQADQKAGGYVNVAAGASHFNLDCDGATSCDKSDTGGKLVGGYAFGNGFSVEAGYITFGKASGGDATSSGTVKANAITLGGLYALPLNNDWGLNFRLGLARVKTKAEERSGSLLFSASENKTKAYAGMGVTYAVSPAIKLELALDSTQGEIAGTKGNLRLISVGASFAF